MTRAAKRLSRRAILALLGASGVAAVRFGGSAAAGEKALAAGPVRRLLRSFDRSGSGVAVGRRYLACHPEEAETGRLLAKLDGGLRRAAGRPASSQASLRRLIRIAVAQDFGAGRMIPVDGWMLAETEVRLCALAALGQGER